jgi:dienelactone hydrolase
VTSAGVSSVAVRPADGATRAVVLVLPGGRADGLDPTRQRDLAGTRMQPFAASLHRRGARHGIEVATLRYRVRGWNGALMSPVPDTEQALEDVRRRHGQVPVVLVGHSMGGRVAMRVAGDASVVAAVGLAPWLPDGEPVAQLSGRHLLLAHGNLDRVTSAVATRRFSDQARAHGIAADFVVVRGETHAMLLRSRSWHRLADGFVLDVLGVVPMPSRLRAAVARGRL